MTTNAVRRTPGRVFCFLALGVNARKGTRKHILGTNRAGTMTPGIPCVLLTA